MALRVIQVPDPRGHQVAGRTDQDARRLRARLPRGDGQPAHRRVRVGDRGREQYLDVAGELRRGL